MNVVNLNDHTPCITTVPTRIVREEESVNDTQVLNQYLCSDGDRGALGVTSFRIVSGDTNNVFSITRSGMLLLVGDLDYEAVTDYTLRIVCEDGGEPPLSAAIDVEVEVIPVNDNPPIFNPVEPITLAEDIPVGATVGLPIAATDQDTPPHNIIRYSLRTTGTPFAISPITGQLTLQSLLDYKRVTTYSLSVQADDSGGLTDTEQFEVLSDIININITVSSIVIAMSDTTTDAAETNSSETSDTEQSKYKMHTLIAQLSLSQSIFFYRFHSAYHCCLHSSRSHRGANYTICSHPCNNIISHKKQEKRYTCTI